MTPAQQLQEKLKKALAILEQGEPYAFQVFQGKEYGSSKGWSKREGLDDLQYVLGWPVEIRQIPLELLTPGDGRALHNPTGLTSEQVRRGYRLLLPEEVDGRFWREANTRADFYASLSSVQEWKRAEEASDLTTSYRVPASTPWPPHPWQREMEAYKRGEEVEWTWTCKEIECAPWTTLKADIAPEWNREGNKFRIKPTPQMTGVNDRPAHKGS